VKAVRGHAVEFGSASRLDLILKLGDLLNSCLIGFVLNVIGETWFSPQRVHFKFWLAGHVTQELLSLSTIIFVAANMSGTIEFKARRVAYEARHDPDDAAIKACRQLVALRNTDGQGECLLKYNVGPLRTAH
jgi:hypothetical protein